ncbi:MAG: hypothetical protein LBE08_09850 [Bifidobacteriaceae bacterium]|nr:hypothetical protein [Bifidobacteriaceae bacterium]
MTLALWSSEVTMAGGPLIINGELVAEAGTLSWEETTPDVPADQRAAGAGAQTLAGFTATPGDSLRLTQPIIIRAAGHNLVYDLVADWSSAGQGAAGLAPASGTYYIYDAAGTALGTSNGAGTPIGVPLTITGLVQGDQALTVVVNVDYPAGTPSYQGTPAAASLSATVPQLTITAQQRPSP